MNNYKEYFEKYRTEISPRGLVMKFAELRGSESIDRFVFVEGSTDKTFYGNTNRDFLTNSAKYIFSASDWSDRGAKIDQRGKKAVQQAFDQMQKHAEFKSDLSRCTFIIDRDYDDNVEEPGMNVTKGHSMESYFFFKFNLKTVFDNLKLSNDDFLIFWKLYSNFTRDVADFFAYKGACTYAMSLEESREEELLIRYRTHNTNEEIFQFIFSGSGVSFRKDLMKEECGYMSRKVNTNKKYRTYYNHLYKKIKNNPEMVRGHDAFRFMKKYLEQIHGIIIDDNLKNLIPIISKLEVEFD